MYGLILGSALLIITVCVTIVKWTVDYYLDPLALRRYPNISLFSGITSIPYMLIASGESRSAYVHDVHVSTGQEILRTGPESLSFSSLRAIKDIYGHSSKCVKDGNYSVQAGTHMHLADVVDKADHARKRKVLSAAYAVKNLEEWEFKVADKVERLLAQFDKREGDVLDLRVWANYFVSVKDQAPLNLSTVANVHIRLWTPLRISVSHTVYISSTTPVISPKACDRTAAHTTATSANASTPTPAPTPFSAIRTRTTADWSNGPNSSPPSPTSGRSRANGTESPSTSRLNV